MFGFFTTIVAVYIINAIVCDVIDDRERRRVRLENNKKFGR